MIELFQNEITGKPDDLFDIKDKQILIAPETKQKYYIFVSKSDRPISIELRTWIGTSPGAVHYYGSITYNKFIVSSDPKGESHCMGYMGGLTINTDVKIEIGRPLTKQDLKDKNRWGILYKEGDCVNAFDSPYELISEIIGVYNKWFKGKGYIIGSAIPEYKSLRKNLEAEI